MGYETDARFDNGFEPPGLKVAASAGVVGVEGTTGRAEAVSYIGDGGGLVCSTGTIEWAFGLGGSDIVDPLVERMTANVLEEAIGVRPAPSIAQGTPPAVRIDGPFANSVTTLANNLSAPVAVAPLDDGGVAVADAKTSRILRIGPAPERVVTELAGENEQILNPTGLLSIGSNRLLVADTKNHCLRESSLDTPPSTRTVAGRCGADGFVDGAGVDARFTFPMGLAHNPVTDEVLMLTHGTTSYVV